MLIKNSVYFRNMFSLLPNVNIVTVPQSVVPAAFHIILNYLTTGILQLNHINANSVIGAAAVLGISLVKSTSHQPTNTSINQPLAVQSQVVQESEKSDKKPTLELATCDGPIKFYKVLNVHYLPEKCNEMIEETKDEIETKDNEHLKCVCCGEMFKSVYCFEKHKRRHLLPVDHKPNYHEKTNTNVRFYPCRACGKKFPSYYFVHKHRQYCDRQTINLSSSTTNKEEVEA